MNWIRMKGPNLLLFTTFSLAYALLAPSVYHQDWDSLMYAYWSEVRGISSIWGNHPLSHVILNSTYAILRSAGYQGKALPIFIACNSIIGGSAVAAFFSWMKIVGFDCMHALGYTMIFGASYGLWHYSGSADVYSFSILFLLLAWIFLTYDVLIRKGRYLYISGALAGLSVLSHQLNAVFMLVALIVILSQKRDCLTRIVTFFGASFVITLMGFIIFGHAAMPSFSISAAYDWIRGYVGDPIYGTYWKLESIPVAWRTAFGIVLAPTYGRATLIRVTVYALAIGTTLLGATQIKLLNREKRIILVSAFIQCVASWLLIIWFEPWYPKFWLLTLVPCMVVIACCIDGFEERLGLWFGTLQGHRQYYPSLLIILGIIVAAFNAKYAVLNEHNPDGNYQKAMDIWLKHSNEGDMLITAGDLIPQLWFWSNRPNTIHLYHYLVINRFSDDRFEYLREQISQFLCEGKAVMFTPAIVDNFHEPFLSRLDLSRDDLRTFFSGFQKEWRFSYANLINGEETQVYELIYPGACAD